LGLVISEGEKVVFESTGEKWVSPWISPHCFFLLNLSSSSSPIYISGNIIGMFQLADYCTPINTVTLISCFQPYNYTVQDEGFDQPPSDDEIGEFGDSDIEEMEDEERNAYGIFSLLSGSGAS
jgi:hypothetical protein